MSGIPQEELDAFLPPEPPKNPDELRIGAIKKDIFARHGIPEGSSMEEAAQIVASRAQESGALQSGWANPEERAQGRYDYASKGKDIHDTQKRWDESIYLMDPKTFQGHQGYVRDIDFLQAAGKANATPADDPTFWDTLKNLGSVPDSTTKTRDAARQEALAFWDSSNNQPLYRKNWRSGEYQSTGGAGNLMANALTNPDLAGGAYMNISEVTPNFLRMQGSGETETTGDSWRTSVGDYMAKNRYRINSPSPIGDLPNGATQEQVGRRIAELRGQIQTAAIPQSDERWKRYAGFVPPGIVQDVGDNMISSADPTGLLALGGAAAFIAKGGTKSAALGTLKNQAATTAAKSSPARQAAAALIQDQAQEQAAGVGIMGAAGGIPGRTADEYLYGGGEPKQYKSPGEVDKANEARQQIFKQGSSAQGVSTADDAAYKRLQQQGLVPLVSRAL